MAERPKSTGLRGQSAGSTEICTVGKSGSGLTYRGYDIQALAENARFEEVAYLLLKGELPEDARLQPLRDLNSYFPMAVPASAAEWAGRAEQVRRRVLVSQGIWPMPSRTELNAVVQGRRDHDGYTIEKVYFEAMPGFYVTGSLYRPSGNSSGKRPGILSPHGHWSNGDSLLK